jgi:hypothetical protein
MAPTARPVAPAPSAPPPPAKGKPAPPPAPAPPGDLFPHPAAALADEASDLTYAELRARAERLLEGEDLPRSKVGIVEALRARAAE